MTQETAEAEVLRNLISEYQEQGFEVFLQPRPPVLPAFLKDFQPDALARRGGRHVIIEIVGSLSENTRLAQLADLVRSHPGWELRVILASPASRAGPFERQPIEALRNAIEEVRRLSETGHFHAALLMAWSCFEAIGRRLMFDEFERPQSPGRLVQVLAQEGYLTPSDADQLRILGEKRNALIHGNLRTQANRLEIEQFLAVLERLVAVHPH